MEPIGLGKLIEGSAERDAIHIAICPVVADTKLSPGQDVGFVAGKQGRVGPSDKPIGIIDPFLKGMVFADQACWLLLYPNTITSLRHHWEHPAISEAKEPGREASRLWMADFARTLGVDVDELMEHAEDYLETGSYWSQGGRFEGEYVPDEFWTHYGILRGRPVKDDDRGSFFSCAC